MGKRDAGQGHVRQRKDGRYEARLSVGQRGQTKVLSGYGATKDEAWAALRRKVEAHNRRHRIGDAAVWTVEDFLRWWVEEELPEKVADGKMAATTVKGYERHVRLRIVPALGHVPVKDLTPADVRAWLAQMRRDKVHDRQRQYARAVLSAALSDGLQYEYVDRNAAAVVPPPTVRYERRDEVSVDVARRLLHAAADSRLHALWVLLLHVPLRPGEPLGTAWSAFDLERGVYRVSRNLVRIDGEWRLHDLKGHRARTIPLPAPVVEALRAHRERQQIEASFDPGWHDPVIRDVDGKAKPMDLAFRFTDGSPLWWGRVGEELAKVCEAAGVNRMTPHGLRHAAVSLLQAQGVGGAVLQQLGGWSSGAMVDHYTADLDGAMREAVEGLAARLRD